MMRTRVFNFIAINKMHACMMHVVSSIPSDIYTLIHL